MEDPDKVLSTPPVLSSVTAAADQMSAMAVSSSGIERTETGLG